MFNINTLKIRHTLLQYLRSFYYQNQFYEVSPPVLTSFSCEQACIGGSGLINVNYYNDKAFLSQSAQLYLEALLLQSQVKGVFCINPAFRAETTLLVNHLSEFWMCEAEILNITLSELISHIRHLLKEIIEYIIKINHQELNALGCSIDYLRKMVQNEIPSLTYSEAIEYLQKRNLDISFGNDINDNAERILCNSFNNSLIIITNYPCCLSSFYKRNSDSIIETTESIDVIAPYGYGEIIGGSIRENNYNYLISKIQNCGQDSKPLQWYLKIINEKNILHGGYGLGIERFISWICNLRAIQDSIPYPRTENNLCP